MGGNPSKNEARESRQQYPCMPRTQIYDIIHDRHRLHSSLTTSSRVIWSSCTATAGHFCFFAHAWATARSVCENQSSVQDRSKSSLTAEVCSCCGLLSLGECPRWPGPGFKLIFGSFSAKTLASSHAYHRSVKTRLIAVIVRCTCSMSDCAANCDPNKRTSLSRSSASD